MAESAEGRQANGRMEEPINPASAVVEDRVQIEAGSDGEGERAARERLKKTSIAGLAQKGGETPPTTDSHPLAQSITMDTEQSESGNGTRGRPAKKRSFEDLQRGDANLEDAEMAEQPLPKSGHHKRMRSRDVASGEHVPTKYEGDASSSVREESDLEAQKSPGGPGILVEASLSDEAEKQEMEETELPSASTSHERADHIGRMTASETTEVEGADTSRLQPSSGFANTSATSPFGSLSPSKTQSSTAKSSAESEKNSTSSSAFASSGLSAFASSEKSPFSTAGGKSPGGFGSGVTGGFGSAANTGFGGPKTTSAFAATTGGFGSAGGFGSGATSGFGSSGTFGSATGFGASKTFGSGLSSFAKPGGAAGTFGTGKPFGTVKSDDEDGSENEDEDEHDKSKDTVQDERFHEQDVETGEEEEDTIFVCRAKLYHFEKEWKERGVGSFKINIRYVDTSLSNESKPDDESSATGEDGNKSDNDEASSKARDFSGDDVEAGTDDGFTRTERRARLLMRTDGVHRVILNTPIFKDMHIGQQDGSEPFGKTMHLTGLEDGKLKMFQIKIGKEEVLKDLYWKVVDLRTDVS